MKNLLTVTVSLALYILAVELIFDSRHERIEGILSRCSEAMILDGELGYRYRPDLDVDYQCDLRRPPVRLVTDAQGFRNRAPLAKADAVVLGDSFADQAYPVWVEAFAARGLVLYNLATQRYATPHYPLAYRRYGGEKDAPFTVVAFSMNDFWELLDFEGWRESGLDWFTFHGGTYGGEPIDGRTSRTLRERTRRLLERSVLFTLVDQFHKRLTYYGKDEGGLVAFAPAYYLGRGITEDAPIFRKSLEAILTVEGLAAERGSRLIVYLVPTKEQVHFETCPVLPGDTRERFRDEINGPYDRLAAALRSEGVICIDDRERFREAAARGETLYPRHDQHWNDRGARLAAEAILNRITFVSSAGADR